MPRALIVTILGDATQFGHELDKAAGKTQAIGKVAGVAGLAIAGGLAYGLEKSVKAAMEAQTQTARLDTAFKASGESAGAYGGQIAKAEASARALGFSNVDVRTSLGSLEIATKNGGKAIADLGVAQDLARFKGLSLADASKTLSMAMAGSQRAAHQLGIIIPALTSHYDALKASGADLTTHTGKLEEAHAKLLDKMATGQAVIQAVSDKVHGQAQAFSDTAAGGMARFHAEIEAIQENLGATLLPALAAAAGAFANLSGFLAAHTDVAKLAVAVIAALGATLLAVSVATKLAAAASAVVTVATSAYTAAQWLLNVALTANPIGIVVVALAALAAAIVVAWQRSSTFRAIITDTFDALKNAGVAVLGWLRDNWPIIATLLAGPFAPLVALATNAFGVRSALIGAFQDVKTSVLGAFDDIKTGIVNKVGDVVSFLGNLGGKLVSAVGDLSHLLYNAGASIIQGLIDGIKSKLDEVKNLAGSIGHDIASLKGPIEADRVLLFPHGEAIMQGLQAGMESGVKGVYAMAAGVGPNLQAGLSGAGGGGAPNIVVNVGPVNGTADQAFAYMLRDELVKIGRREPRIFAGFA